MRHEVILPKQGMYEGEVELIQWLVPDRSHIEAGTPLFLLGTDKVDVEIEADVAGWIVQDQPDGFSAEVGTPIGIIVTDQSELP